MASRLGAIDLSSPSYDNEAASQQLLAEASSPGSRSPAPAAVRGADLLNFARKLPNPAAPGPSQANSAGKLKKPGKLSRVSITSLAPEKSSQKKLRGSQMYDLEPSPQKRKRPHSLPAQLVDSGDEQAEDISEAVDEERVPETSRVQPEDAGTDGQGIVVEPQTETAVAPKKRRGRPRKSAESTVSVAVLDVGTQLLAAAGKGSEAVEADIRSSPPVPPTKPKKQQSKLLEGGESAAVAEDARTADSPGPEPVVPAVGLKPKRKTRPGKDTSSALNGEAGNEEPSKKFRRLSGPIMVSPDTPDFEEDIPSPKATRKEKGKEPITEHQPHIQVPMGDSRSRATQAEAALAATQDNSAIAIISVQDDPAVTMLQKRVQKRAQKKSATLAKPGRRRKNQETHSSGNQAASVEEASVEAAETAGQSAIIELGEPVEDSDDVADEADVDVNQAAEPDGEMQNEDEQADQDDAEEQNDNQGEQQEAEHQDEDADEEGANGVNAGTANTKARPLTPLDKVFDFGDSEEREGECATNLGRRIRRKCASARVVLSRSGDDGPSLEQIVQLKDEFVTLLASIKTKVQHGRRVFFKRDAFAYLFRELTLVLEAMHDKLQDLEGEATKSLRASEVMYAFVHGMLVSKGVIDGWKVKVPQREQGVRLIRDVESKLIQPLRAVERDYKVHREQLQRVEARLQIQREHEARELELERQAEEVQSDRERRRRWQNYHIARMQCEPDPARRRRLRFVEPVQTRETDANGDAFERVPMLGERNAPPPLWTAVPSSREWTPKQETVLLDDLQALIPLDRIFERHCGPRGALRDFSVSDFAAKLAWVRSGWTQLSHQRGWKTPEWVKKIPVLP
ncbi:hypothetical protein E8E13_007922 [Curvularia kusanoi]|uniref:Uncharacterized protein n=1 Tax=Curvularia kusanoi TaxID=90978 RepID=A0A9P4W9V9_CURKU|nr:hypothetical protein E8E13_007922 [Curvularia kusanoi]